MKRESNANSAAAIPATGDAWLELVREQVGSLRYGVVQVTVHDARVIQIERTERVRLEKPAPGNI